MVAVSFAKIGGLTFNTIGRVMWQRTTDDNRGVGVRPDALSPEHAHYLARFARYREPIFFDPPTGSYRYAGDQGSAAADVAALVSGRARAQVALIGALATGAAVAAGSVVLRAALGF